MVELKKDKVIIECDLIVEGSKQDSRKLSYCSPNPTLTLTSHYKQAKCFIQGEGLGFKSDPLSLYYAQKPHYKMLSFSTSPSFIMVNSVVGNSLPKGIALL